MNYIYIFEREAADRKRCDQAPQDGLEDLRQAAEIEQPDKRFSGPDEIIEGVAIEHREKGRRRLAQGAAQHAGALDRAIIRLLHAANDAELVLEVAHHGADLDRTRLFREAETAFLAAYGLEIAGAAEIVHHLHQ